MADEEQQAVPGERSANASTEKVALALGALGAELMMGFFLISAAPQRFVAGGVGLSLFVVVMGIGLVRRVRPRSLEDGAGPPAG